MNRNDKLLANGNGRQLAILGFHKIGPPPPGSPTTWFYIPESVFAANLEWLRKSAWQAIDAEIFLHGLQSPKSLPLRAVLLSFDDGYRSMREIVLPILRSFGFPSVLFVPTAFIGATNRFDQDVEPEEPMCDWMDLAALQQGRVSIQSHGVTHRRLSTLGETELRDELHLSKGLIESHLGHAVTMFSFPYGDNGASPAVTAARLREAGYQAGLLYGGSANSVPPSDCYALQRFAMGPDMDLKNTLGNE
jgi:peptidoglycan/xylan/chitin deacetylase (PgdA/CDA1 family)